MIIPISNLTLKIFSILFLTSHFFSGQTFSGHILDAETRENIPFVNIGILGKSVGTVSNSDGFYSLNIDPKFDSDSIRVFMIGYQPKTYNVARFKKEFGAKNASLLLNKTSYNLDEIVISPKKTKTKIAGHTFNNKSFILGLATDNVGCEIAAKIHIKKQTTFIKQVNINLANNPFDSVLFRINIYSSKNNLPDKNILKQPIYLNTKTKSGTVSVNISKYYLVVEDDFFVSVQWISSSKKEVLEFCSGVGGKAFMRSSSEDTWESNGKFGLGINCKVLYEVK